MEALPPRGAPEALGRPEDLECGKSAYIAKESTPSVKDMLKYRVLTVLPPVYREWSTMTYRRMADWAEEWADPGQYSARKGRGAQEAWWRASLEAEHDRANCVGYAAPFFDMAKCYDMIPRKLAYAVLEWLGIPSRIQRRGAAAWRI